MPGRERASGFDGWREAGKDALVIVPRASTHLEYSDIPLVLPASRATSRSASVAVADPARCQESQPLARYWLSSTPVRWGQYVDRTASRRSSHVIWNLAST